jgi:Flp pilus assembly CpaE family ATPase
MSGHVVVSGSEMWDALVLPSGDVDAREAASSVRRIRRVVVVGAAGGVGTSLVAGGIALGLADSGESVGLLDLGGDLAGAWRVPPDRTIDDLLPVIDELEPRHVELVALRHPSKVRLMLGPPAGAIGDGWGRPAFARLFECAATLGALVVDAGTRVGTPAEEACTGGRVVIVAAKTTAGARSARARLERLRSASRPAEPLLVVNRGVGRDHLSTRAFSRAVGHPVAVELGRVDRDADDLGAGRWPGRRPRSLATAIDALVRSLGTG